MTATPYKVSWWRTHFGSEESQRVADAIAHEQLSQGKLTEEFEAKLAQALGVPHVVATTSGSMALLMALMAAGVGPGDEVIIPNRTWIATAHAALLLGAKVVLVDVEEDRPIMNVSQVKKKITRRTKVIMPVHLNGRSVDMETLGLLAAETGVKLVEDAAQAFGSRNQFGPLGTQSFAGCFSLSVAKIISTGQGGFIAVRDSNVYERLRKMRTHGVTDLINVQYTQLGFNFRFTDVQAAIGLAQLERLAGRIDRVNALHRRYAELVSGLPFLKMIPIAVEKGEVPVYAEVVCPRRDELLGFLERYGIQCRPFYPCLDTAAHLAQPDTFERSERFAREGLVLPCGPDQPPENIELVLKALQAFK